MTWNLTDADFEHRGLDAVIFDLDGVIVTTDGFHFKAWKELAGELGMKFTQEDNHQLRGISRVESLKTMYRINSRELPPQDEFEVQMARKNANYVEFVKQMKPEDILPGSIELLETLKGAGIKCAIASSSKNTPTVLKATELDRYMDAVSDGNNIVESKPDPEVFLKAAQRCHCLPWNCIGIEDAAAGVESIFRADMVSVGIGEQGKEADMVVGSVSELNLENLRDLFEKAKKPVDPKVREAFMKYNEESEF